MDLLTDFQKAITKEHLFSAKDVLLLAVSGGVDSVVLCELCRQSGYTFVIAHCNFQLRDAESSRDEAFVRQLAAGYQAPVLVKRFDTNAYARLKKVSIQVAARELRYSWFHDLVRNGSAGIIVTAHHMNDNIETLLMNFFKGTGIAGLRGMLSRQGQVARPLLFARKDELEQFAVQQGLHWVEDSSNQSDKYARNYFRHQLIPLLKNIYPEAEQNLANNLQRFKDIEVLYQQAVEQHKKNLLVYAGNEVHIPVLKLQKTVPLLSVLYAIIKPYGFTADQAAEAVGLLGSETGRFIQSATHRVIRNRGWLLIAPLQTTAAMHVLIAEPGEQVVFDGGVLAFQSLPHLPLPVSPASTVAHLDAATLSFPLLLRKWKTGDYFYPLGMPKKKKLSRFFIDQKLSKTQKEKIWVLESAKKIIWVVGQRIDDRCKITPSTTGILRISLIEPVQV